MARVRVYGWTGYRVDHDQERHHWQTREILAATSKAACLRAAGNVRGGLFNLCETGNTGEIATAMAEPGVIFWKWLDETYTVSPWKKAAP